MVNYQCYRCGYTNKDKAKIVAHLKRKTPCNMKFNNINLDVCKEYILEGLSYEDYLKIIDSQQKNNKKTIIGEFKNNIKTTISQKFVNNISTKGKFECEFCEKVLAYKQSYYKHLKTCKEKKKDEEVKNSMNELVVLLNKQNDDLKKQLEKRDKQIDEQNKQISELIQKAGINNSTITQNIQNNIKLLAYKDTDISSLTDNDILKCLNHSNMCVPHLVKMIHFNPERPENHNIYISNLKNGYIMTYDGSKWDTLNRDEVIEDIICDKQGLIEERIETWIEEGKKYPTIMKKFERYIEKKENDIVINKIKEEIKLMLFNNRNVIKK